MRASPLSTHNSILERPRHLALLLAGIVLFGPAGCRKTVRTEDPRLKPLEEMLDAQLPPGTSAEKVKVFLRERDCVALPSQKPGTLVVLIPIAQNREASAATARAIFYFDANGKLNTFELARASGDPAQQ